MSEAQDRDMLAAEYVLGTLEDAQREEAARLLHDDPTFAAAVHAWEERLTPLSRAVPPTVPSPDLWDRIAAETVDADVVVLPIRRRLRFWQASTAAALAVAASLAAFIVLRPALPQSIALLAPPHGTQAALIATATNGTLQVRPGRPLTVPAGRDLELWALPSGQTQPRPLGVLPATGRRLSAPLPPGTMLLVSLEPRGGSPTGKPTGPVLYEGRLTRLN